VSSNEESRYDDLWSPKWWKVFDAPSLLELKQKVADELRNGSADDVVIPKAILSLIKFIAGDSKMTRTDMPDMVAKAFVSIHHELERTW